MRMNTNYLGLMYNMKRIKTFEEFMNPRQNDIIFKMVKTYIARARKWPDNELGVVEQAKDMIAVDIINLEKQEEYEICAQLKKAFEYLDELK